MKPLGLELAASTLELGQPFAELTLDPIDGACGVLPGRDEVRLRVHGRAFVSMELTACQRIEGHQLVDLVAEEPDAQSDVFV
jgi:hypothetical protein